MDKRLDDEELDKLLEEEYIKEAEFIESSLLADDDFIDKDMTDEEVNASYQKLVHRLKAEGIYHEDEDIGEAAAREENPDAKTSGKKLVSMAVSAQKNSRARVAARHKFVKAAGIAVVCVLGVFAASMTSEANRNYFVETMKYLTGNDTSVIIGNDSENDNPAQNENNARGEIERKLNVKVPEIMYCPEGFKFNNYYIYENTQIAVMEYEYNDEIVTLCIDNEENRNNSQSLGMHGAKIDKVFINDVGITVNFFEIRDGQNTFSYTAQWKMDKCFYQVNGRMDIEEMKKIIKSLVF